MRWGGVHVNWDILENFVERFVWVNGMKSVRGKRRENWDCVKLVWAVQVPCAKNYDLMYVCNWCIIMNFLSWIKSTFDPQLFHLFIFLVILFIFQIQNLFSWLKCYDGTWWCMENGKKIVNEEEWCVKPVCMHMMYDGHVKMLF